MCGKINVATGQAQVWSCGPGRQAAVVTGMQAGMATNVQNFQRGGMYGTTSKPRGEGAVGHNNRGSGAMAQLPNQQAGRVTVRQNQQRQGNESAVRRRSIRNARARSVRRKVRQEPAAVKRWRRARGGTIQRRGTQERATKRAEVRRYKW